MRLLVDSSVWIAYFRGTDSREASVLDRLLTDASENTILLGDLFACEVLRGVRWPAQLPRINRLFAVLPKVDLGGYDLARSAAALYRELRVLGHTVDSTIDILAGAWCIRNSCPLLHADRDFDPMEVHFGLKVVR